MAGIFTGQLLFPFPGDKTGVFSLINYSWPLLVLAIPNIFFCVAVLCSMAWLSRNKLIIYVSGLCIYIFYIIGSIFSNSPLIAGAAVSSPEEMSLFAKLDPFGIAAFFEQTRYWTAVERNTEHLALNGNFLLNRLGTLTFSFLLIAIAYWKYKFQLQDRSGRKVLLKEKKRSPTPNEYATISPSVDSPSHFKNTILSFVYTDFKMVMKGIPLLMIGILWTALLTIELVNGLSGAAGMGTQMATTGQMITIIMDTYPFFSLLVILFYSSELLWRSKTVKFDQIENATPYSSLAKAIGKYIVIGLVPMLMLLYSCSIAIFVQLLNGVHFIQFELYASLFYYLGLPAILCVVLIISIQQLIPGKYAGLLVASLVIFLTHSSISQMIGITHPMLRYAAVIDIPFSDMNGFGKYSTAFHFKMIYWTSFALLIALFANRRSLPRNRKVAFASSLTFMILIVSGGYIFYHTNIIRSGRSASAMNQHRQLYEERFKKYATLVQPVITDVQTKVDLFPEDELYRVEGTYVLTNNSKTDIDSLLLYIPDEIRLKTISIPNAVVAGDESQFGHYWYTLNQPLLPGDSVSMKFSFLSSWKLFTEHIPFNSILNNGTFLRISNYFPSFGYEKGKELTSSIERNKRKMPPQEALKKLESPDSDDYRFIDLDMTISTSGNQIAIGTGDLTNSWSEGGRNYFRYVSDRSIPFRFAISSAKYLLKRDAHSGIPIEIYYHPNHGQNVDELIADAKRTISYCEKNFGPYPHPVIRFAEISSFAEGFAATAYPGVIFMKENGGFTNNLVVDNSHDIINQLAGHELSHEWWGSASLVPDYREGGWILTETLAKYTELMLYRKEHGPGSTGDIIKYHVDMYLGTRSFSLETPLYKTTFETPHLPYNKGTVVMYQLERLIGEEKMNTALRAFLQQHQYPKRLPTTEDLINQLYLVAPIQYHDQINELFKDIIVFDNKIETVLGKKSSNGTYEVTFTAMINKYREDGSGNRTRLPAKGSVYFKIENEDGSTFIKDFAITNNGISGSIIQKNKPVAISMDPYFDYLDIFSIDNKKQIVYDDFQK
jgi:hypothetical protein